MKENNTSEEGEYDVLNDRNVRVNGQQDITDNILDNLLEDEAVFSESKEFSPKEHSEVCDCEECIPKEET